MENMKGARCQTVVLCLSLPTLSTWINYHLLTTFSWPSSNRDVFVDRRLLAEAGRLSYLRNQKSIAKQPLGHRPQIMLRAVRRGASLRRIHDVVAVGVGRVVHLGDT